jgi:hypothetical protein
VEDDALFDGKAADDSAAAVPEFIIHETLRELL